MEFTLIYKHSISLLCMFVESLNYLKLSMFFCTHEKEMG